MRVADGRVTERRELAPGLVLLWLSAPAVSNGARPGQFVMAHPTGTLDPFLPRPLWIHRLRDTDDGEELCLLIEVVGRGTTLLAASQPGATLRLTGPLGTPFSYTSAARTLLLIGEGAGVAPLVWCADEETHRGRAVTLIIAAPTADRVYPLTLLPPEVEVAVATADGSAGVRADIAPLVRELAGWADQVIASGSSEMYRTVVATLREQLWRRTAFAVATPPMPCGTGICGDCALRLRRDRLALACRQGPTFDLRDLAGGV